MKYIYTIIYSLVLLVFFSTSCTPKQTVSDKLLKETLPKLDELAGNFNPSQVVKLNSAHRAISIKANSDGTFQLDSISIKSPLRKGRLPYSIEQERKNSMPYTITWFDESNKRLGGYSIENPLTMRSCEEGKQEVKVITIGSFEVLLPTDQNINSFQIAIEGKVMGTFNLR